MRAADHRLAVWQPEFATTREEAIEIQRKAEERLERNRKALRKSR